MFIVEVSILFIVEEGFKGNLGSLFIMQIVVVVVITIISIVVIVGGFIYWLCKKKTPLQANEFSFDDVYHYQEARI